MTKPKTKSEKPNQIFRVLTPDKAELFESLPITAKIAGIMPYMPKAGDVATFKVFAARNEDGSKVGKDLIVGTRVVKSTELVFINDDIITIGKTTLNIGSYDADSFAKKCGYDNSKLLVSEFKAGFQGIPYFGHVIFW